MKPYLKILSSLILFNSIINPVVSQSIYNIPLQGTDTITTCDGIIVGKSKAYGYGSGNVILQPAVDTLQIGLKLLDENIDACCNQATFYDSRYTSSYNLIATLSSNSTFDEIYATNTEGLINVSMYTSYSSSYVDSFRAEIGCYSKSEIPLPDFEMININYTQSNAKAGENFNFRYNVKNNSPTIGYITTSAYISSDSILSENDYFLGFSQGGSLYVGETEERSASAYLPSILKEQDYYLLVVADDNNYNTESNEENNVAYKLIHTEPANVDFYPEFSGESDLFYPGIVQRISFVVNNSGESKADSVLCQIFISEDPVLDTNDILVLSEQSQSVYDKTYEWQNIKLPNVEDWEEGSYYLFLKLDGDSAYQEVNENDNIIYKNIIVKNPKGYISLTRNRVENYSQSQGSEFYVSSKLNSVGEINDCKIKVFLSQDDNIDLQSDSLIGEMTYRINSFITDAYATVTCKIPEDYALGNSKLIMLAELDSAYNELNTEDNKVVYDISIEAPFYDFMIYASQINFDTLSMGEEFHFSTTIYNKSYELIDTLMINTALSSDTIFDASDYSLNAATGLFYKNSRYLNYSSEAALPSDISEGDYYILICADADSAYVEKDELNNTGYQKITVVSEKPVGLPDFYITDIHYEDTVTVNNFEINGRLLNSGGRNKNPVALCLYYSEDENLDEGDIIIDDLEKETIYNGENVIFYFGSGYNTLETGNGYFILKIDAHNQNIELNEDNNIIAFPIYVENTTTSEIAFWEFGIDGTSSSIVYPAEQKEFNFYVRNFFGAYSDTALIKYYISSSDDLISDSILIFTDTITKNNSGSNYYYDFVSECLIPDTISEGAYGLIALFEATGNYENYKSNNDSYILPIWVQQADFDISVLNFTTNTSLVSGYSSLNFDLDLNNNTSYKAKDISLDFFISEDDELDDSDRLIKSFNYDMLPESKIEVADALELGFLRTMGEYNIFAEAYSRTNQIDTATFNNIDTALIYFIPSNSDIIASSINFGDSVLLENNYYNLSGKIENIGTETISNSFKCAIYLSKDTLVDSNDILLDEESISSLYYGQSRNCYFNFNITEENLFEPGNYYLVFYADNHQVFSELNEENNISYKEIEIPYETYDFEFSYISLEDSVAIGGELRSNFRIQNSGFSKAESMTYKVFLSEDSVLNKIEDTKLSENKFYSIYPNNSYYLNLYADIPDAFNPGNYYLFIILDSENEFLETNEENNIHRKSISLVDKYYDIQITQNQNTSIFEADDIFNNNIQIYNNGNIDLDDIVLDVYFSKDANIDESDTLVSSMSSTGMNVRPGGSVTFSSSFNFPDSIPLGDYYVINKAEILNIEGSDLDTSNNIIRYKIKLAESYTDLGFLYTYVYKDTVVTNEYIDFSCTLRNNGLTSITSSTMGYYFSKDTIYDSSDVQLATDYVYSMDVGGSNYESANSNIPAGFSGQCYILFVADIYNNISEDNEGNNTQYIPIYVTESHPELSIINYNVSNLTSGSNLWNEGDRIYLSCNIRNSGVGYADSVYTGYYLSADTLFDNSDFMLTESVNSNLCSSCVQFNSEYVNLPYGIVGELYMLFVTDNSNYYNEENEWDNIANIPIVISTDTLQSQVDYCISDLNVYIEGSSYDYDTVFIGYKLTRSQVVNNPVIVNLAFTNDTGFIDSYDEVFFVDSVVDWNGLVSYRYHNFAIEHDSVHSDYITAEIINSDSLIDNNILSDYLDEINGDEPIDIFIGGFYNSQNYWLGSNNYLKFKYNIWNLSNKMLRDVEVVYSLIDADEYYLGKKIFSLNKSEYITVSDSVYIPFSLKREQPILKIVADSANTIIEEDEDNNSYSYYFNYNLNRNTDIELISSELYNQIASPEGVLTVSFTIQNNQDQAVENPDIGIYLSNDTLFSADDIYLDNYQYKLLLANESREGVKSLIIPASVDTGYYYLLCVADYRDAIIELNEENNVDYQLIHVINELEHDLSLSMSISNQDKINDSITYQGLVSNRGDISASDVLVKIYLSFNNELDNQDILLDTLVLGQILNNDSVPIEQSVELPSGIPSGNYYLLFVINSRDESYDTDSENNLRTLTFTVDLSSAIGSDYLETIKVYPNPVSSELIIETDRLNSEAYIYDLQGRLIKAIEINENRIVVNVSNLNQGQYIIRFVGKDNVDFYKFFKE